MLNRSWKTLDCLIYSPVLLDGMSFVTKHTLPVEAAPDRTNPRHAAVVDSLLPTEFFKEGNS